jgi:hypothetical protein
MEQTRNGCTWVSDMLDITVFGVGPEMLKTQYYMEEGSHIHALASLLLGKKASVPIG